MSTPVPFSEALELAYAAHAAWEAIPRPGAGASREARQEYERQAAAAARRHREAHEAVMQSFARERGWRVAQTDFTLSQLRTGNPNRGRQDYGLTGDETHEGNWFILDHREYYRSGGRPSRPVAIVAHPYCKDRGVIAAYAARLGLAHEVLSVQSWYFPAACLPVLFTRLTGGHL